jgi:hypothetical protein
LIERRKAHLDVELRELRLSIGAQIFVAKTVGDLKVLIEAADHAQLFEELRRLWQCKKLSGLNARRDDVVARAFRRRLNQYRSFDLTETLRSHVTPDLIGYAVTKMQVRLQLRPAQIEITILQT